MRCVHNPSFALAKLLGPVGGDIPTFLPRLAESGFGRLGYLVRCTPISRTEVT